jgi:hypothetical protein
MDAVSALPAMPLRRSSETVFVIHHDANTHSFWIVFLLKFNLRIKAAWVLWQPYFHSFN